jgi:G3E family GTPase
MRQMPVTVIGGYLGAGKTTLVNHVLRHARGLRLAVLVNDFGELPIDADLITSRDGDVISIAGGCMCCSFGSDLMAALLQLPARVPRPEHVLIETSGVALPGAVARSVKLLGEYALDGVVVLADAETVRQRAVDPYMGDTIDRQLAEADLIVLNKADLVAPAALDEARVWLGSKAARARVVTTVHAQVPAEVLLGSRSAQAQHSETRWTSSGKIRASAASDAAALYESASFTPDLALDVARLAHDLALPDLGLLRAKGLLRDRDGSMKSLQLVGTRWEVAVHAAADGKPGRLVCIGLKGSVDKTAITRAIARAAAS